MSDWSAWIRENPLVVAIAIVFGGPLVIGALGVLLIPVFILAESNAVLGFVALLILLVMSGVGIQQFRATDTEPAPTNAVDPITELEGRYVRGELTDEEFEHRLDKIIETEDRIERATPADTTRSNSREVDTERATDD